MEKQEVASLLSQRLLSTFVSVYSQMRPVHALEADSQLDAFLASMMATEAGEALSEMTAVEEVFSQLKPSLAVLAAVATSLSDLVDFVYDVLNEADIDEADEEADIDKNT